MNEHKHGFRHDPSAWARQSDSLEAAMVRLELLGAPADGDHIAIRAEAERYVAKLGEKMDMCNPPALKHDLVHVACKHGLLDAREVGKLILETAKRDDDGTYICAIEKAHS